MDTRLRFPAALAALAIGCGSATPPDAATAGGGGTASSAPLEPKLSAIQAQIFNRRCGFGSCHGFSRRGGLSLAPGDAYAQLVSAPAQQKQAASEGRLRVVPGNPDASFLVVKLSGPPATYEARMPRNADPLPANELQAIRNWIAAGAAAD